MRFPDELTVVSYSDWRQASPDCEQLHEVEAPAPGKAGAFFFGGSSAHDRDAYFPTPPNPLNVTIDKLRNVFVFAQSVVVTEDGLFLEGDETSLVRYVTSGPRAFAVRDEKLCHDGQISAVRELKGRTAIAMAPGVMFYYHVIIDIISRLWVLKRQNVPVDQILTRRNRPKYLDLFIKAIFPDVPIVEYGPNEAIMVEETYVVSKFLKWQRFEASSLLREFFDFLEGQLLGGRDMGSVPSRIYTIRREIRADYRVIANAVQIKELMERRGFVEVFPGRLSIEEQVYLYANSQKCIQTAGSANANIGFMPSGSAALILVGDTPFPYPNSGLIAQSCDIHGGYVFGTWFGHELKNERYDFHVDPLLMEEALSAMDSL